MRYNFLNTENGEDSYGTNFHQKMKNSGFFMDVRHPH